jgi:hypothetical protein
MFSPMRNRKTGDVLATYRYVLVRVSCRRCSRFGCYRLAALAERYGARIDMGELLGALASDCVLWERRHPNKPSCGAYFPDLEPPWRPPDLPPDLGLRLVAGGKKEY